MLEKEAAKRRFDLPGHMSRAVRELLATGEKMDFFIVVVDARAPRTTMNAQVLARFDQVPRIVVAMKADLCASLLTGFVPVSTKQKAGRLLVLKAIRAAISERVAQRKEGGMVNVVSYGMVVGMPNVGKSSLINFLAQKKKADAQDRPGVTKRQQWVKITEDIQLWDTPGILPKSAETEEELHIAALLNLVPYEEAGVSAAFAWLWSKDQGRYASLIAKHYGLEEQATFLLFLSAFAARRGHRAAGGSPDLARSLKTLFVELSSGTVIPLSLDPAL